MKLIVLLGNPGKKYEQTRHNTGFLFGEYVQNKWGFSDFSQDKKFFGQVSIGTPAWNNREKVLLLKPQTFMNLSGKSVLAVCQFYKIPMTHVILAFDDKDQDFGKVRFRKSGSAGGHNGVKDICQRLGTQEIARIKIGISNMEQTEHKRDTADFVLSDFSSQERITLEKEIFDRAENMIQKWICDEQS